MIKHIAYYFIHMTAHPINLSDYEGFNYIGIQDRAYVYRLDVPAANGRIADFEASLDANPFVKHYEYNEVRCVQSQYDADILIWAKYDHSQNHWYVCATDSAGNNESEDNGPFESVEDAIKDMEYNIASEIGRILFKIEDESYPWS